MKTLIARTFALFFLTGIASLHAQVPQIINYQGRVTTGTPPVNFDGAGQFKFALVDGGGAGVPATATAMVGSGRVTAINVTAGGYGYLTPPVVTITPVLGFGSGATATAQVANGAVSAITVNTTGTGYTAMPLVSIAPPAAPVFTTYWSNDGTSTLGLPPSGAVALPVVKGLYSVLLGNTALGNMTAIPPTVFGNADVRLRVWFNDGVNGFQLLSPDQRIAAVGYALMAANVPTGAISTTQLADGAVTSAKLATGAVGSAQLAAGAVQTANIAANAITATQLAAGAVGSTQLAANAVQSANIAAGAITSSQIASGAVGSTQLAAGAVGSTQLAANAVQSGNLAPGAVAFADLAKPPQSGTIAGTSLSFEFGQPFFTVTFPQPFAVAPAVTLSLAPGGAAFFQPNTSLVVTSVSPTQFSGKIATFNSVETIPDADGDVGSESSLIWMTSPHPTASAIAYHDTTNGDLKFVLSPEGFGRFWSPPVVVDSAGDVGRYPSMRMVNGRPAIAYYDVTNGDLKYVRANESSGTTWGTPLTLDSTGSVGLYPSLAVINGAPAIAYYDSTNSDLKYVRATDASGTSWGSPGIIDTIGGKFPSLEVVNGNPAVAHHRDGGPFDTQDHQLRYVRAANADGTAWNNAIIVDDDGVGAYPTLIVADGFPAISYFDEGNANLNYVRASNANGTAWSAPLVLDGTVPGAGAVGEWASMVIANGNPAICSVDFGKNVLKYMRATNAAGTAWGAPVFLPFRTGYFTRPSLCPTSSTVAVSFYDVANRDLNYVLRFPPSTNFQINWIALPP